MITKNIITRGKLGIILLLSAFFASCSEDVNKWDVDPSYDRLYQTTHFEVEELMATSVKLKFNGISDATKYIFEFSIGNDLEFNNIVRTEEVKADTLTPYSEGKVVVQNEYLKLFEDLGGTTQYCVRVKGVNEQTGSESKWHALSFKTPAEQIFIGATPGIKDATLNWESDKTTTNIVLSTINGKDTTEIKNVELTAAQKSSGQIMFDGLKPGTTYMAQIMNGEFNRGTWIFNTLGSSEGVAIEVNNGDNINSLLANAGSETVTLIFKGGQYYEIGNVNVPAPVKNLYMAGTLVDGQRAELHIPSFGINTNVENLHFQYIDINAQGGFWMMVRGSYAFNDMYFTGCIIRNLNNCILYANANIELGGIFVDNCILDHVSTGGWGAFNIAGNTKARELQITNTTIMEVGDQLMDIRVPLELIKLDHITFCNFQTGLPKFILATKQPGVMQATNMIIAGDNAGTKINSGYGDYSSWLDFSGCYMTSDFPENTRKFTNITHLDYTTEEFFVDPRNGDFHIKDNVTFRARGKVGDPRWYK